MTRNLSRTHLHSSAFVQVLADLAGLDTSRPPVDFADRLAQWIHIADAIALRATHTAVPPAHQNAHNKNPSELAQQIRTHFASQRDALQGAIRNGSTGSTYGKAALPRPKRGTPAELLGSYEPYKRYYIAHQRELELKIKPLRAKIRTAVASHSAQLHQLAALDAALESTLEEREAMLLAKTPTLMERRFRQLRQSHADALARSGLEDNPDLWLQPGGWLTRFADEIQAVLLAELDLRLQPTIGLLEALDNEIPLLS